VSTSEQCQEDSNCGEGEECVNNKCETIKKSSDSYFTTQNIAIGGGIMILVLLIVLYLINRKK
jgi:hypothetical protein